ncbi:hypothetical protein CRYUN_Cryun14cG0002400 [Craigia yunnanensis]
MEQQQRGCQASLEAPKLCANNCGFFGTAATMNLCSKCHKDLVLKQDGDKLSSSPIGSILGGNHEPASVAICPQTTSVESTSITTEANSTSSLNTDRAKKVKKCPNKCTTCKKRIGLTGFTCRCGDLFCAVHRYSDKHDCPYNYRCAAQDAIAKANPVLKASKLDKI